jgi:ankyrin repeat protein
MGPWIGGLTALHFAAREGHIDTVEELVRAGADVNIVAASDNMSVITMAIINGQFDMAKFLIDRGANPNLANTAGLAPLFALIDQQWAARTWYPPADIAQQKTGYMDLMQDLLAHGANANARMGPKLWFRTFHGDWVDPEGATPFWRAAQSNDVPAMKLLVARGADPNIPTVHGCSPVQAAAGYGYEPQVSNFAANSRMATLKYLVEELHANVNSKDDKGYTPLHGAALMGDDDIINYLVSKGADPKARASMIYGRADDGNKDVDKDTGDTVADMANGPRERNLVYPDTIALLEKLGSENTHNCRASTCVLNTLPDKQSQKKPQ